MIRPAPGMAAIRNAVENACQRPVTDEGILAILRGDGGAPAHVHTVFGDVSLQALESAGAAAGIGMATILLAYQAARDGCAAANPELDALLAEPW